MKKFLFSLIIISFMSCNRSTDKIVPEFSVTFISGCNVIKTSKIIVYFDDNKYYADHTSPTYFDGKCIDSLWTLELNKEQINACSLFLNKAKTLPEKCNRYTSSENHHIVIIEKDTFDINGDCDWNNFNFNFLDKKLFGLKHIELAKRKELFLKELDNKLFGIWYLQPFEKKLKKNDTITFDRHKMSENYLEFSDSNVLNGNCLALIEMKDLKRYQSQISISWNKTVITLDWGKVTSKRDYNTWYESGATFTLNNITDDELRLNFLWSKPYFMPKIK